MHTKDESISLANLLDGAAIEAVDHAIKEVWENVLDPNTTDAVRSVTMEIKVKPTKGNRELCDVEVNVKPPKLAPTWGMSTQAYVGADEHGATAAELVSGHQMTLPDGKVVEMGGAQ